MPETLKSNSHYRILTFLSLVAKGGFSVKSAAKELAVTERSVYRYITEAEVLGFAIDYTADGKLFMDKSVVPPFVKIFITTDV